MSRLLELASQLREEAAGFEADRWSGPDCAAIAEELAATAKACAVGSARAAARAVACHAGSVEWLARTSGSTPAQAREALATVKAAEQCPATSDARRRTGPCPWRRHGRSCGQRRGCPVRRWRCWRWQRRAASPVCGRRHGRWRSACATVTICITSSTRSRSLRHWVDELGMVAGHFRLPPEVGVPFINRLDAETERLRRAGTT